MPEPTPEQQRAEQEMADWVRQHQTPTIPDPFGVGRIGTSVRELLAAAGAGQFAIAPDTAQAIIDKLTEVQKQAQELQYEAQRAAVDPRFGGGYAEQVGRFVQQVAAGATGSAEEVLTQFRDEVEQLKVAVAKSTENYQDMDASSARDLADAGGQS